MGAEGGMRDVGGIYGKKSETSDGLLQGMGVCYPTCSEGFRCQAREDQHQGSEEGIRMTVCRWREMGVRLVNRGEESA